MEEESSMILIRAGQMVSAWDQKAVTDGSVLVSGEEIQAVGSFDALKKRCPEAEVIGSSSHLLIPGLVNGHGHGHGLSTFQRGALDNTMESWTYDTMKQKPLDTYDQTCLAAAELLLSGVTTTMHNHHPLVVDHRTDFEKALFGYSDAGIRVQFNPGIIDPGIMVYGDTPGFLQGLPENLKSVLLQGPPEGILTVEGFVQAVKHLHAASDSGMTRIGFGPLGPCMVRDDLLMAVRRAADSLGAPIHIHGLQTILQKIYARNHLGKPMIRHLHDIGFLGKGLTIGHCTWPTKEEIALLADTQTAVTHHAACNLRVRCGIAPVFPMLEAGVRVGIGMDDKSLNDDQDFLQEMRTVFHLQKIADLGIDSPYITPRQIFKMATINSAELLGFGKQAGRLEPGRKADLVLLDYDAMCGHYCDPMHDPIDTMIYRGSKKHVDTVMVNGRVVVKAGRVQTIDVQKVVERVRGAAGRPLTEMEKGMNLFWDAFKQEIVNYYREWRDETKPQPYYLVNARR